MQLITNKISTGKPVRFEDFIKKFQADRIKTASVKVAAEQEEAESSGQLKVEPLHQKGESTTMPKAGPSAKKDTDGGGAKADKDPEKDGEDSGQCKAEGSEKFTNNVKFDPNDSTDEEKGIVDASADTTTKVAAEHCPTCKEKKEECSCECKDCTAAKEGAIKEAGKLPEALKEHQFKAKDSKEDDTEKEAKEKDKEEKEASAECSKCNCDPCECDKKEATATQFIKWANLDSKNKSFLTTYWRQLFGDEYVSALVADK